MRRVVIWFFSLFLFFGGLVIGAYFLAKKYEEPVRNYIVGEVNKRLDAPVHVGDINFSLLERFPSASLVMDSVWAEENIVKIGKADTLLFFRKVYLNLNIFDLLEGQYKINEIEAKDGFVHLFVDDKGYDNFHIWKQSEDSTGFLLELNQVHIENGEIAYVNELRQQNIQIQADDLKFQGKFSQSNYTMVVDGDGRVDAFGIKGVNYLENRDVAVESELNIDAQAERYEFSKGRLIIDDVLDFNVAGKFESAGVDLHIVGNNLDIIQSISLIPIESRTALADYQSSGILDLDCTLKGAFGNTENPRLRVKFSVLDATVSRKGSNWKLTKLKGSGSLDNGELRNMTSTSLIFESLSGQFNEDAFESAFSVVNFNQPTIDGSAKLSTDIEALDEFLAIEFIEAGSGQLTIDAKIKTTLRNPGESSARDFLNSEASGMISLVDAKLKLKDDERNYGISSAIFRVENNSLVIENYEGVVNDCRVLLNGRADHFLDYFFTESGKLDIRGKIEVSDIDLEALFPSRSDNNKATSVVVAFPQRASWNLELIAKSFTNGKFRADEVSGHFVMNEFKAEATSLHFLSQGGNVQGMAGVYRFGDNQFGIKTDFDATGIDVKTLFETFNNFDQEYITSAHISGEADANTQFQAFCDSTFIIDTKSIISSTDLIIRNGAIKDFSPLISVADEIKKKPMLRLFVSTEDLKKRLTYIQFAELKNEISIRNEAITIPNMEIKSSAIDLNVSGTHSFDNHINYAMDFALSELLQMKDRTEPYNEYVQRDTKGRTRIYLTMIGTTDDFDVELERTNVKSTLKDEMKSEKNTVKGLLQDEFKILGKDTSAKAREEKQPDIQINFDPEAGTSNEVQKTKDQPEAVKEKNVLNKIIKKTETDKKKLKDGEFEDDDF